MFPIVIAVLIAFAAIAVFAILPDRTYLSWSNLLHDEPESNNDLSPIPKPRFPSIEGKNINGRHFKLPAEFEGLYNVVAIAYDDLQQPDVDDWISRIRNLEDAYPDIRIYELPVVREMPWFQRERYEFWMSSDTTDTKTRASTITLYTDVQAFNWFLKITDPTEITVALVDRFGNILWHERGKFNEPKFEALENNIINLLENIRIYVNN